MPSALEAIQTEEAGVSTYKPLNAITTWNHIEFTQSRLNNRMKRLKLSQRQSIYLVFGLEASKYFGIRCSDAGHHHLFMIFFNSIKNNSLGYCINIRSLITNIEETYPSLKESSI